jgi:hypothetical protein
MVVVCSLRERGAKLREGGEATSTSVAGGEEVIAWIQVFGNTER